MVSHPLPRHDQATLEQSQVTPLQAPWIYQWARWSFVAELAFTLAMLPVAWILDVPWLWLLGFLLAGPPRFFTLVFLESAAAVYDRGGQ
jgi:hypothetical protein